VPKPAKTDWVDFDQAAFRHANSVSGIAGVSEKLVQHQVELQLAPE